MGIRTYKYDAFMSHAVEDKIRFANDLEKALTARGAKLWYSGRELRAGDPLDEAIREGLVESRYGIIIVSSTYLAKIWTMAEFAMLYIREKDGESVILPVLLDTTPEEVSRFLPIGKLFSIHADKGIDFVADKLMERINTLKKKDQEIQTNRFIKRLTIVASVVMVAAFLLTFAISTFTGRDRHPQDSIVSNAIEQRIALASNIADKARAMTILTSENNPSIELMSVYAQFKDIDSRERNIYQLKTGISTLNSKKRVNEKLGVDLDNGLTPLNSFGLDSCIVHLQQTKDASGRDIVSAFYMNLRKVTHTRDESMSGLGKYQVSVSFKNNIRVVEVRMTYPLSLKDQRKYEVSLIALPPSEVISFHASGSGWKPEYHP